MPTEGEGNETWDEKATALASYPGLLTPAFVTCSINMGEGLVKLSDDVVPGRVEEWHIPSVQLESGFLNPRNVAKTV